MEMQSNNSYNPVNQSLSQDINTQPNMNPLTNQVAPDPVNLMACSMNLKSTPQFVVCPFCKQLTPTRTERSMSFTNLLMCVFCSPTIWAFAQILRQKDLSCFDAKHYCMKCNSLLANYTAC